MVPAHGGQAFIGRSPGLGDALGFVSADERTLQSKASPDIFIIGDVADLRASKVGSVAHFEGDVLLRNIRSFLAGQPLSATSTGTPTASSKAAPARRCSLTTTTPPNRSPGGSRGRSGCGLRSGGSR